jgi:acetyl/propionyl-CoA carboxylase alpha subunit
MSLGWVAAAVAAVGVISSHQDATAANYAQRVAIDNQKREGENALALQVKAQADQKATADAALAQQKVADQARIDQNNAAMKTQQDEFNTTFAANQANAAGTLAAQKEAATQQFTLATNAQTAQKAASDAQLAQADRMYKMQSEAANKANQKAPDAGTITSQNVQQSRGGQAGTMLTGGAGVDMSSLLLGKNTLLGS